MNSDPGNVSSTLVINKTKTKPNQKRKKKPADFPHK